MTSDFVAPDHAPPPLARSFPDSLATPRVEQSPLLLDSDATHLDRCICGCAGGACIPQREYQRQRTDPLPQHDLPEMILFKLNGKCGYPLKDALLGQYTGLDGRDNKMFVGLKSSGVALRLEWLPYQGWSRQIRTSNFRRSRDEITLEKLATQVARRMNLFFEEMREEVADPSYQRYGFQPGVIDVYHLELVALKRVCKYSYMPHFRLMASAGQPQPQPL